MRLPMWLRFLMPLMAMSFVLAFTAASVALLWLLHWHLHPGMSFAALSGAAFSLMFYPSFFGVLAPALMLLNLCLRVIPSLRRIFDESSRGVPRASYQKSMSGLRKLAMMLVPPALILALIGATEPWAS
jgi:hypothetical protein